MRRHLPLLALGLVLLCGCATFMAAVERIDRLHHPQHGPARGPAFDRDWDACAKVAQNSPAVRRQRSASEQIDVGMAELFGCLEIRGWTERASR